jgi:two-component system, NarL family, nitrate/nitrite response regulator NarL
MPSTRPSELLWVDVREAPDDRPPWRRQNRVVAATVLVVDDHPTFRRFARRMLEEAGFHVVGEAGGCSEAMERARDMRPQALLLDVLLPDGSGLDVAAKLSQSFEGMLVVLTSSRCRSDFGAALDDVPMAGFIPKSALSGDAFAELLQRA